MAAVVPFPAPGQHPQDPSGAVQGQAGAVGSAPGAVGAPAGPDAVAAAVEQTTRTVIGAAFLLGDALGAVARRVATPAGDAPTAPTGPGEPGPDAVVAARRVALGLALEAQRRTVDAAERGARLAAPTARWVLASPIVRPVAGAVARRLEPAYQRGEAEEGAARSMAARTGEEAVALAVPVVLGTVDLEPVVGQVLDELDLKPVITRVMADLDLPVLVEQVMADIDLDPVVQRVLAQIDMASLIEQVMGEIRMSSVVLDATGGITTDVVGSVRDRGVEADALVERVVGRVLRRKLHPLTPVALAEEHPVVDPTDPDRAPAPEAGR